MVQVISGYSKSLYAVLGTVGFVALIDTSMISPIIAAHARALNADPFWAGLIAGSYSIVAIPMIVLAGYLSDILGRRRAMVLGFSGDLLAMALYATSPTPGILLAARILHATSDSFIVPSALALIGDLFARDVGRPLSFFWIFVAISIVLGSGSSAGLVTTLGFPAVYAVIGALIAASLIATLMGLPAPPAHSYSTRARARISGAFARRVAVSVISMLSMYLLIGGVVGTLPTVLIDRFGLDERGAAAQIGLFMAISTAVSIPIFPVSARLAGRRTPLAPLTIGLLASMSTALALEFGAGLVLARIFSAIVFGLALGTIIFSSSYLVVTLPIESRGLGSGLNQSASLLGVALGAPLTSLYVAMIGWAGVFTLFGAIPPLVAAMLIWGVWRGAVRELKE